MSNRRLLIGITGTAIFLGGAIVVVFACPGENQAVTKPDIRTTGHISQETAEVSTGEDLIGAKEGPRDALAEEKSPEKKLADALGLKQVRETQATELMKKYSVDDLDLLARIQRKTGKAAPLEVSDILEAREKGASFDELMQDADRLLSGNFIVRLIVEEWLRKTFSPHPAEVPVDPK